MAFVDWEIQGTELASCNCNWGCPCQFNALPDKGHCRAHSFLQIDRGHFGEVRLDGLRFGFLAEWPAAIHQGNGTWLSVVDERADAKQRAALEAISHGKETDPFATLCQVAAQMVTKVLPTEFRTIELAIDVPARKGTVRVPGLLQGSVEPIKNPVTGAEQKVKVSLPDGFEYLEAEFASGNCQTQGPIALAFKSSHAHLAKIHWNRHGVVR